MAEMNGGKKTALEQKGKRSKPSEYVNNVQHGYPQAGLKAGKGKAGSPKSQASLSMKGSKKS